MTGTFFRWFFGSSLLLIAVALLFGNPWLLLKIVAVVVGIPLLAALVLGAAYGGSSPVGRERDGQ